MSDIDDHQFFEDRPLPEPERGVPPWVLPAAIGAVVALLVVGLVLIITSGDDDEIATDATDVASTAPIDTEPLTSNPAVTEPVATEPVATEPPATEPPATEPPATEPPATEPPSTEPPVDQGAADPVGEIGASAVSIADGARRERFEMLPLCASTRFVGFQVYSAVLVGDQGTLAVLDYELDEGGAPGLVVTEVNGDIEGQFFGRDNGDTPVQWAGGAEPFVPLDRITLQPVGLLERFDGTPIGPISISVSPSEQGDCATGFTTTPSPFASGEQVTAIGQFDVDGGGGTGFAVLAECTEDGRILSGGGLLSFFVTDEQIVLPTIGFPALEGDQFLTSLIDPAPTDSFIEQQGGGGDTVYAANVETIDAGSGYITWTDRPTVAGGLTPDVCAGRF